MQALPLNIPEEVSAMPAASNVPAPATPVGESFGSTLQQQIGAAGGDEADSSLLKQSRGASTTVSDPAGAPWRDGMQQNSKATDEASRVEDPAPVEDRIAVKDRLPQIRTVSAPAAVEATPTSGSGTRLKTTVHIFGPGQPLPAKSKRRPGADSPVPSSGRDGSCSSSANACAASDVAGGDATKVAGRPVSEGRDRVRPAADAAGGTRGNDSGEALRHTGAQAKSADQADAVAAPSARQVEAYARPGVDEKHAGATAAQNLAESHSFAHVQAGLAAPLSSGSAEGSVVAGFPGSSLRPAARSSAQPVVATGAGSAALRAPQVLASGPASLDVGVFDGTHGWLRIRAELGTGGAVNASLTASAAAHEPLKAALPQMASYLGSEAVSVSKIAVHRFGGTASSGAMAQEGQQGTDMGGDARRHAGAQAGSQSAAGTNEVLSGRRVDTGVLSLGSDAEESERPAVSAVPPWSSWPIGFSSSTGGWLNVSA